MSDGELGMYKTFALLMQYVTNHVVLILKITILYHGYICQVSQRQNSKIKYAQERSKAFENLFKHISEEGNGVLTVTNLVSERESFLQDSGYKAYTTRYMKCILTEPFGNQITNTNTNGKDRCADLKNHLI